MPGSLSHELLQNLDLIADGGGVAGLSDSQLLDRYLANHDDKSENAFNALVSRHGPMVLGVCRHILLAPDDVNDAFQATFLVLVRKASSVRVSETLAPWLYGVAYRIAVKSRSNQAKRRKRETNGLDVDAQAIDPNTGPIAFDLRPVLYEELNRLPEKYRSPVVLCHLEGLSHEEAALKLRCPVGTLSGRLSRARDLLRTRLTRRGLGLTASTLAALLAPSSTKAAFPSSLLSTTVQSLYRLPSGSIAPSVAKLSQGVITAMLLTKLKLALLLVSTATLLAVGASRGLGQALGPDPLPKPTPASQPAPKTDPLTYQPQITDPAKDFFAANPESDVSEIVPGFPKLSERLKRHLVRSPVGNLTNYSNLLKTQSPLQEVTNLVQTETLIVSCPGGKTVDALSFLSNQWRAYPVPDDIKVAPVASGILAALAVSGKNVSEIAVFSAFRQGEWYPHRLREPASGEIVPEIAPNGVLFRIGKDCYAFSVLQGIWADLHLEGEEEVTCSGDRSAFLVRQGEMLYVFSFSNAAWSKGTHVSLKKPQPAK